MRLCWQQVRRVFEALAYVVKRTDPDGIDLYLANSRTRHNSKDRKKLLAVIEKMTPKDNSGRCDMKMALHDVLSKYAADLQKPAGKSRAMSRLSLSSPIASSRKKQGLSVYVFTDGVFQEGPPPVCGIQEPIALIVDKLTKNDLLDAEVGIQFIRFGNDPIGEERLEFLDSKLKDVYNIQK
jgi:hypothetical protein